MDRRSTSIAAAAEPAARLAGRSEAGRRHAPTGRARSRGRDGVRAQRRHGSRRPSDARSDPNRTRAVSRAGTRAAGCSSNRGGTLDGGGTVRSGAWGARGIASRSPTCARATHRSRPSVVEQRLRAIGAPEDGIDEIGSWLRAFRDAGVDGLPVGPVASAVLADAVLAAGDDALRSDGCELRPLGGRRRDLRPRSPGDGQRRSTPSEAAWASLGLEMHERKTVLLDDPGHRGGVGSERCRTCARRPPRCDNRAT